MSQKVEIKSFSIKFDNVDSQGTIRGYASTFGNIDLGLDVVDKGAFKKSIKESGGGKWPILADHNPSEQIGWNLRAEEDGNGLFIEGKLDLNVQKAREKYSLTKTAMELGAKMGLSIGYMVVKAEPDREKPMVRHLKELKLFEYSIVTFPMNTEAAITNAKSSGIDKCQFFIQQLIENGYTQADILKALKLGAAEQKQDPVLQSCESLLKILRS